MVKLARAQPVATAWGRGVDGRGWAAAWHGQPGLGRLRPQLVRGKTKYKSVACKGKPQICMQCSDKSC
jgi:hypothetical protein